jgi:hypothetical protein
VSIKKKAKGKTRAAKGAAEAKAETKNGKNIVEVRGNIDNLVKNAAELIAAEVIKVALTGQLATAKYLFEAVGLYPPTEQTAAPLVKDTLAHTLLSRMGLPTEPVIFDEDEAAAKAANDAKSVKAETTRPIDGNEPEAEREDEPEPDPGDTVQ